MLKQETTNFNMLPKQMVKAATARKPCVLHTEFT